MNSPIVKLATCPAVSVAPDASVRDAVRKMVDARVGGVAVVAGDVLVGIFTERDLMTKVVRESRDPDATPVSDVMVTDPVCATAETPRSEALELMIERHFRHLPVVDRPGGALLGMLSIRNLLQHQVHRLQEDVRSLEQYLLADGPGG